MSSLGAAQAVSGMAAGDTGPKLPYTAIFNRALKLLIFVILF
jgi:hypothetical protein